MKINPSYLKYVADLETPTLGFAPGAPPSTAPWYIKKAFYRNQIYRGNFPDIPQSQFDDLQVHHALPQATLNL